MSEWEKTPVNDDDPDRAVRVEAGSSHKMPRRFHASASVYDGDVAQASIKYSLRKEI